MTPTQKMYDAATAAALELIKADVEAEVPFFFRSEIPQDNIAGYARVIGKACVDAALSDDSAGSE